MNKLEEALKYIEISRRKSAKDLAWGAAEHAAEIAGVRVYQEERSNYPDLERLEKDVRTALGNQTVIVTRHKGLVKWLRRHGIEGEVIDHVNDPADITRKDVIGVLPLELAALVNSITTVSMELPAELRGVDLTPEQMDEHGAHLVRYIVTRADI